MQNFPAIASLVIMTTLGAISIWLLAKHVRTVSLLLPGALATTIFTVLLTRSLVTSPFLANDEIIWHRHAISASIALSGQDTAPTEFTEGKAGYPWLLGALYLVAGPAPLIGIVLNLFMHIWLIIIVTKLTEVLCEGSRLAPPEQRIATNRASFLVAGLPCLALWVPNLFREAFTWVSIASALLLITLSIDRKRSIYALLAITPLAMLIWVRGTLGAVVVIAMSFSLVYVLLGASKYALGLRLISASLLLLALPFIFSALTEYFDVSSESIAENTTNLSEGASSGFPGLNDSATFIQVISITGPRVLAGPFPWEWSQGGAVLLGLIELVCWAIIVFLSLRIIRNRRTLGDSQKLLPTLLVTSAIILIGLMLVVGNYGILARFRPIVTSILIPLAAIGSLHTSVIRQPQSLADEKRTSRGDHTVH